LNSVAHSGDAAALLRANRHGILCMCAAMACFVVNDSLVKYASQSMASAQLVFIRGVMASILVLALARSAGALHQAGEMVRGTVATRAWVDAVATFTYLLALFHLPLVNATAIMMTAPLFIALIAGRVMHERVGIGRWLAIVAGFVGVLLVIQPRAEGFNAWSIACLGGTVLMAVRDVMTRRIAPGVSSSIITLATALAVTVLSGAVSVVEGWRAFGAFEGALLGFAALFLAGGYYFIVAGMRRGELSVIGPFRYSALVWAVIIGFVVWGEIPNALGWLGIALVTLSGLYVVYGERRRANRSLTEATAARKPRC
jgi:drug/metabolite transporter (DMT)-like permease